MSAEKCALEAALEFGQRAEEEIRRLNKECHRLENENRQLMYRIQRVKDSVSGPKTDSCENEAMMPQQMPPDARMRNRDRDECLKESM